MNTDKKQPPDAASTFDTKRMRACAPLLPEPGDDVVLQCLDEVDALRSRCENLRSDVQEVLARADRAEKERDEARALCASIRDALSSVLDLDRSEPEVGLFPVTDKELPEVIKNREESLSRHLNELIAERDRAIAERDEAREAWGRAESDACEWEEKAGVASADLATFTEKLHKAEQERDDLGCQLEALRAIQRGDVADLRTRMEAVEGRIDTIVGIKMARNDDEKGGA